MNSLDLAAAQLIHSPINNLIWSTESFSEPIALIDDRWAQANFFDCYNRIYTSRGWTLSKGATSSFRWITFRDILSLSLFILIIWGISSPFLKLNSCIFLLVLFKKIESWFSVHIFEILFKMGGVVMVMRTINIIWINAAFIDTFSFNIFLFLFNDIILFVFQ